MVESFTLDKVSENPQNFVKGLKKTGFAIITDHGISKSYLDSFYEKWARFFNSSISYKNQFKFKEENQTGYFPFGLEKAKGSNTPDLKEFYHFYLDRAYDPTEGITTLIYNKMNQLGLALLKHIQEGLPLEVSSKLSEPLVSMACDSDQTLFRIIHYPAITGNYTEGVRAAPHEDINLITLLPMATAEGLEVLESNGNWLKVGGDPNAIIINVGDMLQEATGGYLKSTTHRVINTNMDKPRYSAPLFIHPKPEVKLSDRYTANSYLQERLNELGLIKKEK